MKKYRVNKKDLNEGDDYWALELSTNKGKADFSLSLSCWDEQSEEMNNKNIFNTVDDALNFILSGGLINLGQRVEVFNYTNPLGKVFTYHRVSKKWTGGEVLKNSTASNVKLSNREYEVAVFMAKGFRNLRISKEMNLNEKTISTYMRRIYVKSGLAPEYNVHALIIRLMNMGLLRREEYNF